MSAVDLSKIKSVHFIGIGGIGISAIARMFALRGIKVSGSDRSASKITEELSRTGIEVYYDQGSSHIPHDCDLIIYTVAIPQDNLELIEAQKRGIRCLTYPQTLALISKEKYTIAISGTHGKTTTTAMVAHILLETQKDPTVIVGSLMKLPDGTESNFVAGRSNYLVVEADEYKKSFHNLYPHVLVINNIDEDHLDFYKDLADIQNSFLELAQRVPADGVLICDTKNPNLAPIIKGVTCRVLDYLTVEIPKLKIPGEHNRNNARAAMAVVLSLGIAPKTAQKALESFSGVWRRFEYKGTTTSGTQIYDDYAHNPQKVQALISGAREHMGHEKRLIIVFQPHLFSRTKSLLSSFATAFKGADEVILLPIFAAREVYDATISSEMVAQEIAKHQSGVQALSFRDAERYLRDHISYNDVLITVGAGEAYIVGEVLLEKKFEKS